MKIHEPTLEEQERFLQCRAQVVQAIPGENGIGTLGEKSLHAIMKHYLEPDESKHEQVLEGFVADIVNERGVTEIQTANFDRLRRKIDAYLPGHPLTIVHPLPALKYLCWYDEATGEEVSRRKSPKQGKATDVLRELYRIRQWLLEPGLRVELYFVDLEEHRLLDGWDKQKKRGSTRVDRLPLGLDRVEVFAEPEDYLRMLPAGLPEAFKTKDVARKGKLTGRQAYILLRILRDFGLIEVTRKEGNAFIFERNTA